MLFLQLLKVNPSHHSGNLLHSKRNNPNNQSNHLLHNNNSGNHPLNSHHSNRLSTAAPLLPSS